MLTAQSILTHPIYIRRDFAFQFLLSHIEDIGRYQLSISIVYFKVPGCAGRVTSASVVRCIYACMLTVHTSADP